MSQSAVDSLRDAYRRRDPLTLLSLVFIGGITLGLVAQIVMNLIYVGEPMSPVTKTTAFWDFNNLWSGARMALDGEVERLWDADAYRERLREMHAAPDLPNHEWSYPPHMLLFGVLLGWMAELPAYLLWTFTTFVLAIWAVRSAGLGKMEAAMLALSPLVLINLLMGQNGALTAGLLVGGFALLDRRPIAAGVLFGLLTVKPHWGLLIPFILLIRGEWRTIITASVTALAMLLTTTLAFGTEVWTGFLTGTVPLMTEVVMNASIPQSFQGYSATWFIVFRELGAGVGVARALQGIVILVCIVAACRAHMMRNSTDPSVLIAFTALLAHIALPYGYAYEMIGVGFAAIIALRRYTPWRLLLFVGIFSAPFLGKTVFEAVYFTITPFLTTALAVTLWQDMMRVGWTPKTNTV